MSQRRGNDEGADGAGLESRIISSPTSRQPGQGALVKFIVATISTPKARVGILLWIIGFLFMAWAPPLVKVTPEMEENYDKMVVEATNLFPIQDALDELAVAQDKLYKSQVWFWRWSSEEVRSAVFANQAVVIDKQKIVDELQNQRTERLRKANGYVGIWSKYGMQDVRERFWSAFESGKVFAQRQTFWQMFMSLLSSREEHLLSVALQWVFTALINFTLGLLGALFYFVFSLASMVWSYEAGPLSGAAFYVLALLGGTSMVATYLMGLYGMAAGGVYVVGKFVLKNAIRYEQQGGAGGQRRNIRYRQQQHED